VVRGSVRKLSHKKTNHPLLARVFCLFVCLFPLSLLFLTKRKASDYSKKKNRPVRLAYQPPANSIFLSEQISHQQPASSTFLSKQISTSHQPPAKRTG
jgi:hypothetical protein